jgi:signal transduction histidine kinase
LPASLKEPIFGLVDDGHGALWLATSNHVLRVNRDNLLHGRLAAGDVREFGPADGLRGIEGVKRDRSVLRDTQGRIWLSVNQGIAVVDPVRLLGNSPPASADIQAISADGASVELKNNIHIRPGSQRIVFSFAGLILSRPELVRYRYWLEGYDRGWSEPVTAREAGYTNLSPGPYRFHVIASNPDGVWGGDEAAIAFSVIPAWWQTWWFRAGLVGMFSLCAIALYRLRLRQLTGRLSVRFEERLAERTRIAQELHDTLLQGFLSARMQVHVAAARLPADSQEKPSLTRSLELMSQVIEEGRNAVRGLRASQSASMDLEDAFSRIPEELKAGELTSASPVDFRVIAEGPRRFLHPVLRDEVYRIGREALINAFRHANAKSIELELNYSSSLLRLRIRDDGCGIDMHTIQTGRDGHWGLSGMRERSDRIGARFRLWSSPGAGTEVELSVPGHIAFQNHAKPRLSRKNRKFRENIR